MNIQAMMKQAQEMQERLKKQMSDMRVEATAGGGMVTVVVSGDKQLQQMQGRIAEVQQRLDETVIEASSGGGAVTVKMNAHPSLQEITIKPEVIDPDDAEMLQDLIQAAMNDALERVRASQMQQLAGVAGGLNIPGLTS